LLQLHHVQAAVIPRNRASVRVLEKAGFRREGHALRYLQIAGEWEDHDLFALLADEASSIDA
jgi:[ribosomal protein S5]-alanine N-acetyltransferase